MAKWRPSGDGIPHVAKDGVFQSDLACPCRSTYARSAVLPSTAKPKPPAYTPIPLTAQSVEKRGASYLRSRVSPFFIDSKRIAPGTGHAIRLPSGETSKRGGKFDTGPSIVASCRPFPLRGSNSKKRNCLPSALASPHTQSAREQRGNEVPGPECTSCGAPPDTGILKTWTCPQGIDPCSSSSQDVYRIHLPSGPSRGAILNPVAEVRGSMVSLSSLCWNRSHDPLTSEAINTAWLSEVHPVPQ